MPASSSLVVMVAESIGNYPIVRVLGEGGMGTVYLARDPIIDRFVAIKVLRTAIDGPTARARLLQEARAAGRLTHPNIVSIFHIDEQRGQPYVVMEYVEGQTLAAIIRDRIPLTVSRKLHILERVCSALACAHDAGLVHRDIKPTNIIVDTMREPRVLDFGLAKLHDARITLTQEHAIVGTLCYMSPEQLHGSGVDHRSDLFAVATVAYEFLTGRRAFAGDPRQLAERILHGATQPATIEAEGLDPDLATMLTRGLDPRLDHRFQSARELEAVLRDLRRARIDPSDDSSISGTFVSQVPELVAAPTISTASGEEPALAVQHRPVPSIGRAAAFALGMTGVVTLGLFAALDQSGQPRSVASAPGATTKNAVTTSAVRGRNRMLSAGTELRIGVLTRLDSRTTTDGDSFAGVLSEAVVTNGQLLLPTGTRVEGRVERVGVDGDQRPFITLLVTGIARDATVISIKTRSSQVSVPVPADGQVPPPLLIGGSTPAGNEYYVTQLRFAVTEAVNLER